MSLVDLASKIYTVKSRKNLSASSAFTSLIREDLAMRFSVFNITKALTGSEFIATILQSKYGKLTPIQREEAAAEKKQLLKEKRFKQFTVNSIVNLNNKITTLTALTEKNTALILNLYNDLGSFRNIRKDEINKISSLSAVRTKIRSRTVKYQIDQIRDQINLLQEVTVGRKIPRTRIARKNTQEMKGGVSGGGGITIRKDGQIISTATKEINFTGRHVQKVERTGINSVDVVIEPSLIEDIINMAPTGGRGRGRGRGRGGPKPGTPKPGTPKPGTPKPGSPGSTASKILKNALTIPNIKSLIGGSLVGAAAYELGPGNLNRITGAFQESANEITVEQDKVALKYGLTIKRTGSGAVAGFEIDGKQYEKFEDLPREYQNIIDAYIIPVRGGGRPPDTRSGSATSALKTIAETPSKYKMLETREGRAQVLEPPTAADIENKIIRAAMTAQLTVTEPQLTTPNLGVSGLMTAPKIGTGTVADSATSVSASGRVTNKDQFVQVMLPAARSAAEQLGNPALALGILGQWAGETNVGKNLSADFNYAGIKAGNKYAKGSYVLTEERYTAAQLKRATESGGESIESIIDSPTKKFKKAGHGMVTVDGWYGKGAWQDAANKGQSWVQVRSHFAKFNSLEDFVSAYVSVLKNKRYASAIQATDPKQFGLLVAQAGYATAGAAEYSKKVGGMVASLGLAGSDSYGAVRTSSPMLLAGTPGAAVSSPSAAQQMVASSVSNQLQSSMGEVVGSAALIQGETLQNSVVSLNNRISSLEEILRMDREDKNFPVVRNQAEIQTGYA